MTAVSRIAFHRFVAFGLVAFGLIVIGTTATGCASAASKKQATKKQTSKKQATTVPGATAVASPKLSTIKILKTYPHDITAFTEGLEVRGNTVYESSGLEGKSKLLVSELNTGKLVNSVDLDTQFFAEGLTILPDGKILQFTWKEKTAFLRDGKTLAEIKRYTYDEEGWGMCYSAAQKLIVHSNGTSTLRFRSPTDFSLKKSIDIKLPAGLTPLVNELECVGNTVYANIWQTNNIVQVDLKTGAVLQVIDASGLGPKEVTSRDDVLNGIAKLPNGNFLLTGKRWPESYEVSFVAQ